MMKWEREIDEDRVRDSRPSRASYDWTHRLWLDNKRKATYFESGSCMLYNRFLSSR